MPPLFDQSALLERVDNDWGFLAETVEMLGSDGRGLMREIRAAVATGDAAALGGRAHTLKGMISNFCSPATHAAALHVETMARSGDLAGVEPAIKALDEHLEALIAALREFLAARA